jgi:hypothetical protein
MTTTTKEYMNLTVNGYRVQIYQIFEAGMLNDIVIFVDGEEKEFFIPSDTSPARTNIRFLFIDSKGNLKPLEYLDYFLHWIISLPGEYTKHPLPEFDFDKCMMSSTLEPYQL